MRGSLQFVGGVLVGFGLGISLFAILIGWTFRHMFIMGVSGWQGLVVLLLLPLLLVLLGVGLAMAGRRRRPL